MNAENMAGQSLTDEAINAFYVPLYNSIQNLVLQTERPLLAHYTSLDVLEKIMKNNEIWLSNPLFMNDLQEMRFGMQEGLKELERLYNNKELEKICRTNQAEILWQKFRDYFRDFEINHALDVYVFCLSEHAPDDNDGQLSMWRGYGGNGNGAALVFRSEAISSVPASPLLFVKVQYSSNQERREFIAKNFQSVLTVLKHNPIPDDKLFIVAYHLFNLLVIFSLSSKHHAFLEEHEWRIIYLSQRDRTGILKDKFHYVMGRNGIEPKLKLEIQPLFVEGTMTWTFDSILDRIILGPTQSSVLAARTIGRMLELNNKSAFKEKVVSSNIPFRSSN